MHDGTVPPIHVEDMSCEQLLAFNSLVKKQHFSCWTQAAQRLARELGALARAQVAIVYSAGRPLLRRR
jgi:hypothetical protein